MDSSPTEPPIPGENDAPEAPPPAGGGTGSGEGAHSALQRMKELERSQPGEAPPPEEPQP